MTIARRLVFLITAVSFGFLLSACATQPAPAEYADVPGFWLGIVHGMILPFTLIASIFSDVRIYAFPNAGGWYDFGYFLGVSALGGGAALR